MKNKLGINNVATRIIILLTLIIGSTETAYSEDSATLQKCSMMTQLVGNIVDDRDAGMTYKSRLTKNNNLSGDIPAMNELLTNMTKVVYKELKSRPKLEITNSTFYACMKTGG